MTPADLKRLQKYMLEVEGTDPILDEMRAVVETEWPELVRCHRGAGNLDPSASRARRTRPVPGDWSALFLSLQSSPRSDGIMVKIDPEG